MITNGVEGTRQNHSDCDRQFEGICDLPHIIILIDLLFIYLYWYHMNQVYSALIIDVTFSPEDSSPYSSSKGSVVGILILLF